MTALASQMVSSEARHMLAMKAAQALRTRQTDFSNQQASA